MRVPEIIIKNNKKQKKNITREKECHHHLSDTISDSNPTNKTLENINL
jgi:hypothetical protein